MDRFDRQGQVSLGGNARDRHVQELPILSLRFSREGSNVRCTRLTLRRIVHVFVNDEGNRHFAIVSFGRVVSNSLRPNFRLL